MHRQPISRVDSHLADQSIVDEIDYSTQLQHKRLHITLINQIVVYQHSTVPKTTEPLGIVMLLYSTLSVTLLEITGATGYRLR